MHRYRIVCVRTSYQEIEITADDSREAEARFNQLAELRPSGCEWGEPLTAPRYRIVDVTDVEPATAIAGPAERSIDQRRPDHARHATAAA